MKKIIFCFLLLVFALPNISSSADDSKRKNVEELLGLIKAESIIDTINSQRIQMVQGLGQKFSVKPEEQELFDEYFKNVISKMNSEMTWGKIKEPVINIYMKTYSEKEIADMAAFYKSDLGQTMVQKQPEIAKELMLLTREILNDFIPEVMKMGADFEAKLNEARKNK